MKPTKNQSKKVIVTFPGATCDQINGAFDTAIVNAGGDVLSSCYNEHGKKCGFMVYVGWTDADVASFWGKLTTEIPNQFKKGF